MVAGVRGGIGRAAALTRRREAAEHLIDGPIVARAGGMASSALDALGPSLIPVATKRPLLGRGFIEHATEKAGNPWRSHHQHHSGRWLQAAMSP
jgi:hypothetical protein